MKCTALQGSCAPVRAGRPAGLPRRLAPAPPALRTSAAPRHSAAGLRQGAVPARRLRGARVQVAANYSTNYAASHQAGLVAVKFQLPYKTNVGESFSIVGDIPELGEWSMEGSLPLEWSDNHVWCGTVALPAGSEAEFKCVLHRQDGTETWQLGDNRKLTVPSEHAAVGVNCSWDIAAVSVEPLLSEELPAEGSVSLGSESYSEEMLPPSQDDYELQQARQTLQASADKIDSLQRMVDDLRQNHLALQEEWEASGGQLTSDLYQQLVAAEQGLMEEARQLNGYAHQVPEGVSPEHMSALTQELARVKSEFSQAQGALHDANSQIAALRNELNSVAGSYQEHMRAAEAEMASRMAQFQQESGAEIERLQRALAESQAAAQGGSMGSQDGDVEGLRQELAAAKAQLAKASQVQQSAGQEAQAAGEQVAELKQRLQQAEAEIGSLRAWIDQSIEAQSAPPQQAAGGEQQVAANAASAAEVEELRQQLASAQYYMQQAVDGHRAAAQAAEEATRREYALYEQLQAAHGEIGSLRAWIDQAMGQRQQQQQ